MGLGESKQKLFFLPEAQSHFNFLRVIGEELGMVGASLIFIAFCSFLSRHENNASRRPDRFGFYLAWGCTFMVALAGIR